MFALFEVRLKQESGREEIAIGYYIYGLINNWEYDYLFQLEPFQELNQNSKPVIV